MASQEFVERPDRDSEPGLAPLDANGRPKNLLTAREATAYVGCASVKSFYEWRKRRGVRAFANGLYSRAALDRARALPRKRHEMAPASLGNLRLRWKRSA